MDEKLLTKEERMVLKNVTNTLQLLIRDKKVEGSVAEIIVGIREALLKVSRNHGNGPLDALLSFNEKYRAKHEWPLTTSERWEALK